MGKLILQNFLLIGTSNPEFIDDFAQFLALFLEKKSKTYISPSNIGQYFLNQLRGMIYVQYTTNLRLHLQHSLSLKIKGRLIKVKVNCSCELLNVTKSSYHLDGILLNDISGIIRQKKEQKKTDKMGRTVNILMLLLHHG